MEFVMKLVKCLKLVLIAIMLLPLTTVANERSKNKDEIKRAGRLIELCKLWNQIKHFHPYLGYRSDIDWDAALIKAIPTVDKAKDDEEFAAALQGMLDALGDPATCIIKIPAAIAVSTDDPPTRFTEDNILIVNLRNYAELDDVNGTVEKFATVITQLPKAKGVIFDLRSNTAITDSQRDILYFAIQANKVAEKLSTVPLYTPAQRMRMHVGYTPQASLQITGFFSGFTTQEGRIISPAPDAKDLPVVCIVNRNSYIPYEILGLQAAQRCIILAEGEISDSVAVNTRGLQLTDGISVQIRLGEMIFKDGKTGVKANLQVSAADKVMETAVHSIREFKPAAIERGTLPTWVSQPLDKAYPEMAYPAREYRLLAAFRFWGVINYYYPYKHLLDDDWNSVIGKMINLMEAAQNSLEYNLAIAQMTTYIHDTHTNIRSAVYREFMGTSQVPIRVRFVEGLPVISSFRDEEDARNLKLEIGDIILKVDGEDVNVRVERLKKYLTASTPQAVLRRVSDGLLAGPDNSTVALTIKDRLNQIRTVQVPRKQKYTQNRFYRNGEAFKLLPGNVGYVDFDRLTVPMIEPMMEKLKDTVGIIFDMRSNPRGTGFVIARRLTDQARIPIAIFRRPVITSVNNSSDLYGFNLTYSYLDHVITNNLPKYRGKTVMLIDDRAQSQAETVGMVFKNANGTVYIGSATAGTDGEVTTLLLPGDIAISFTGQELKHADGRQLQRIGLIPDIEVHPTIKGMQEGRDEVLEKAVNYLTKEHSSAKN